MLQDMDWPCFIVVGGEKPGIEVKAGQSLMSRRAAGITEEGLCQRIS